MKNRLLMTSAIAGLAFFAATPASAACTPTQTPGNGQTITCSGASAIVNGGTNTGITVNLDGTANITDGTFTDGIILGQGAVSLASGSVVNVGAAGIHVVGATALSTITVNGSVTGGSFGVLVEDGADITINAGATVVGGTNPAIATNFSNTNTDSIVRISNGATITGNVVAGAGANDEFHWIQDTAGTFDNDQLDAFGKYQNFEKFFKDGPEMTTLTGSSAQQWTINSGTLRGSTGRLGAGTITVNAGGTLDINSGAHHALDITGAGNFTKSGAGTLRISANNNNFTGATSIIGGGTLQADDAAALSATSGISINASTFQFGSGFNNTIYDRNFIFAAGNGTLDTNGNTVSISGTTSGAGTLVKSGAGTLVLSGATTATGNITVSAGTLSGATNTLFGNITNNATLAFDQNADGTFAGNITGTGNLIIDGSVGTVTLTGTNTYSGGTNVLNNVAGTTSSLQGNITNAGFITFNQSTNGSYAGVLSGAGNISKTGTGTVTFTNTNTSTGAVTIDGGRLAVNGSLGAVTSTTVGNTGTLGGTGTVRNVTINSGGTMAPGNSIGTLNVTGTVDFANGSHYAVEYDNASADNTIASGAITINSGAILDLTGTGAAGTFAANQTYTILQGSAVTGTFGTVNNNLAFLDATQNNTGTQLRITLARNGADYADIAKDSEQREVANAVTQLGTGNAIFDAFLGFTAVQGQDALDDLSGEHIGGIIGNAHQSIKNVTSHIGTRLNGLTHSNSSGDVAALALPSDPSAYTAAYMEPSDHAWDDSQVWFEAIGSAGKRSADGAAPAQDNHSYGALAGIDTAFSDKGYFGFYAGYENGELETNSQGASSAIDNYHAGVYATYPVANGFNLLGGVSGAYHSIDTTRHVFVGATSYSPHGDTDGMSFNAFAELSKPVEFQGMALEPFANVAITHSRINGYTETGGGAANLVVDDNTATNPSTTLGARTGKVLEWSESKINLTGSLGWQHVYGDVENAADMRFQSGTTIFDSAGAPIARDAAVIGLAADANLKPGVYAYGGYTGTLGTDAQDHGFKAGLKVDF